MLKNELNTQRPTFSILGSTKPLDVIMKTRTKKKIVLLFKKPQFHLHKIVQYEANCKGPRNEVSIGYTNNEAEREISVEYLAPNRKYICKVSSIMRYLSHVSFINIFFIPTGYLALLELLIILEPPEN